MEKEAPKDGLIVPILIDVLGQTGKTDKRKSQYSFNCPNCADIKDKPGGDGKFNLEVNVFKNVFHCWSCGTRGNIFKLIKYYGNSTHFNMLKNLGIDLYKKKKTDKLDDVLKEVSLPSEFISFSEGNPNDLLYKQAKNYLKHRGITDDIIEKYNMGYITEGEYANRIILPSYDTNSSVNYFVGRSWLPYVKMKYKNPEQSKSEIIFNEKHINWDSTVYIVEGPFDHIVVPNSVPMLGKQLSDKLKNRILEKLNGHLVILLDPDAWETSIEIYKKLNGGRLYGKIRVVKLENNYDISDINKIFKRKGLVEVLRTSHKLKESRL